MRCTNGRSPLLPFPPIYRRAHTAQSLAAPAWRAILHCPTLGMTSPGSFQGFCITHLLSLKNAQRADCSCISWEDRSSCDKNKCIADSLWCTQHGLREDAGTHGERGTIPGLRAVYNLKCIYKDYLEACIIY